MPTISTRKYVKRIEPNKKYEGKKLVPRQKISTTTTRIPQQQTGAIKTTNTTKTGNKYTAWDKAPALQHHGAYNFDVQVYRTKQVGGK